MRPQFVYRRSKVSEAKKVLCARKKTPEGQLMAPSMHNKIMIFQISPFRSPFLASIFLEKRRDQSERESDLKGEQGNVLKLKEFGRKLSKHGRRSFVVRWSYILPSLSWQDWPPSEGPKNGDKMLQKMTTKRMKERLKTRAVGWRGMGVAEQEMLPVCWVENSSSMCVGYSLALRNLWHDPFDILQKANRKLFEMSMPVTALCLSLSGFGRENIGMPTEWAKQYFWHKVSFLRLSVSFSSTWINTKCPLRCQKRTRFSGTRKIFQGSVVPKKLANRKHSWKSDVIKRNYQCRSSEGTFDCLLHLPL